MARSQNAQDIPRLPLVPWSPTTNSCKFLDLQFPFCDILQYLTTILWTEWFYLPFDDLLGLGIAAYCRKPFNVFVIYFLSQDIAYHCSPSIKVFKTLSHHRKPVAAKMRRHILTETLGWHWLRRCDSIDGFSIRGPIALSGSPRGLPLLKLSQSLLTTTKMTPGQRLCNIMQL